MEARDDSLIIKPLRDVSSLSDFWNIHFQSNKFDIFPLVDITYLIDLKLEEFGMFSFHLSNLIYWFLCLFSLYWLFRYLYKESKHLPLLLTVFIAIHPVSFMVVSWISGRKHILGFLFMVLSFFLYNKWIEKRQKKYYIWFSISYLGVVVSHLLYCLLPVALVAKNFLDKKHDRVKSSLELLPHLLIWAAWSGYNYFRYWEIFRLNGLTHNNDWLSIDHSFELTKMISMVGKYVFRIFVPFFPAASYEPLGLSSFIGILLLLIFTLAIRNKKVWGYYFFFIFPILFVVWKVSIVIIDTYMLWPLLGLTLIIGHLLKGEDLSLKKYKAVFIIIPLLLAPIDYQIASAWSSNYKLQKMTYENEGACYQLRDFARVLLVENRIEELIKVGEEYFEMQCQEQEPNVVVDVQEFLIFYSPKFSQEKKIEFFRKRAWKLKQKKLFLAALFISQDKLDEGLNLLKNYNHLNEEPRDLSEYNKSLPQLFLEYYCRDKSCSPELKKEILKLSHP
ncbi:MAG: hypothetical protein CME65_10935 [Halobacteriovoraceae bacterium]|nr:hypothetical protein [Halobacteriovoraceae bacterium]|tara:strand:+ start:3893 stop:5407 length:1515 start_codon:yes stop_codon:yes gene_type:complete